MQKVVLAYSGGLDTTFCALHLSKDLGYEVHAVLINTGGFSQEELKSIESLSKRSGNRIFYHFGCGRNILSTGFEIPDFWQCLEKRDLSPFGIC